MSTKKRPLDKDRRTRVRRTAGLTTLDMHWKERIRYLVVYAKLHDVVPHAAWDVFPDNQLVSEDHGNRSADKLERWIVKMTGRPVRLNV